MAGELEQLLSMARGESYLTPPTNPLAPQAEPVSSPQEVTETVTTATPNPALSTQLPGPVALEPVSRETTNLAGQDYAAEEARLAEAERLKAEGIQETAAVEQQAGLGKAELVDEYVLEMDQMEESAAAKLREADEDVRVLAGREPDPARFWNNADTMTKVLYSIAALVQSVDKPGEVPMATKALNDMISRDIAIQEGAMGRELDAAKGRARTARELIQMSGDKSAVTYKEKQARIAALAAAAASSAQGKVQTADTLQESHKLRQVLIGAARENRREYERVLIAEGRMSLQASRSGGGGGGGGRGGGAPSMAPGPDGVKPDMIIPGLTGAYGVNGDGVKINKLTSGITGTAFRDLADIGTAYQSGQTELAKGLEIAYRVKEDGGGVGALQKDPEWIAWLNASKTAIAKAQGAVGNLTQRDVDAPVTGMGAALVSAEGFLSTLAEAQATPEKVIGRLQSFSEQSAIKFKDGIKVRLDPEFIPEKMGATTAQSIYERRRRERDIAQQAEREELVSSVAKPSSGAQEAINALPIIGGKDALSREYASIYSDARTPKERDKAIGVLKESAERVKAEIAKDPRNVGARIKLTRLEGMIAELSGVSGKDTVKAKDRRAEEAQASYERLDSAMYDRY